MEKKTFTVGIVVLALLAAIVIGGMSSVMAQTPSVIRVLPSDTQTAGSLIMVSLDVSVGSATYYLIDEEVPTGWTVTNASGGGDFTAEPGHVKWVVISGATDTTYTYTVIIPGNATGDYAFTGEYGMEGMTLPTVTIGGDTLVSVDSGPTLTPPQTLPSQDKEKNHVISPSPALTSTPMLTPTSALTPTPTISPMPSPSPTPGPTLTPTPTPEPPGFEAVFAIAGLLAVAYLVLRRKRK